MSEMHAIEKKKTCTFWQNLAYNFTLVHPIQDIYGDAGS